MLNVDYGQDRATVAVTGEITDERAVELVDCIKKLRTDYFYPRVVLEVTSPGGFDVSLSHCLDAFRELRASGLKIDSRVRSSACSAAAILVSLGDHRTASATSRLLFHNGRMQAVNASITADAAAQIGDSLHDGDTAFIEQIAHWVHRRPRPSSRGGRARVKDFARSDWDVIARLSGGTGGRSKRVSRGTRLKALRGRVATCLDESHHDGLAALYADLFLLDRPISAFLARELRLIDAVDVDGFCHEAPGDEADSQPGFRIPQWDSIFPPRGHVPRDILCRHALILGETGSGKTVSGILPVVSAILAADSPVGCALVIDPKHEVGEAALALGGQSVRVIDPKRQADRDIFDLMQGKLSIATDLEHSRVKTAAHKILCRAASLTPGNPAATLAGLPSPHREPYWDMQGARLAQTVLALVLSLITRRKAIFGTKRAPGALCGAPPAVRKACVDLGERAGCLQKDAEIESFAGQAREALGSTVEPEVVRTDFARNVRDTSIYGRNCGFSKDFEELKAAAEEPRDKPSFVSATRDLIDAACLAAARCPEFGYDLQPTVNVLALAEHALQSMFPMGSAESDDRDREKYDLLAATVVKHLRATIDGAEIDETFGAIGGYWNKLCGPHSHGHFGGIIGHARMCFDRFADEIPARTLFFGCEPGLRDRKKDFFKGRSELG